MNQANDVADFRDVLINVATATEQNGAIFKDKYFIFLNEDWKPWPHVPENMFKKSFVVCLFRNREKHLSRKCTGSTFENKSNFSKREKENDCNASSDFTGSPLEYMFDVTDVVLCEKQSIFKKHVAYKHSPLTIIDARYVSSLCHLISSMPDDNECLKDIPFFLYCDGKDMSHVVLIGMARNDRAVVMSRGAISKKQELPNVFTMKKQHLKCFPISFSEVEIQVYSHFDIIGSCAVNHKTDSLKPTTQGVVSIECTSSNFRHMLEKPPTDSTCLLLVQAVAGNENEGAHNRFKELKFIKALYDGLKTGEMSWPNKDDSKFVLKKLQIFLDGLKHSRTTFQIKEKKSNEPTDFDSTFLHYVTGERDDMDFTDHLWHILLECTSYEELVSCFSLCFSELKNFPFVPYIYRTNLTTIGKMIRNMDKQHLSGLSLESTEPLKLLLELGVEKLLKDYVMLFVGLEMVPYEFLTPYLNEIRLSENSESLLIECLGKTVKCLEKFHTVEELLIIFWSYLESSKAELNSFVRMALKHYATVDDVDSSYIFKFPISLCSVKHIVGKFKPVVWQASLKSRNNNYEKQSIIRFCKKVVESPRMPMVSTGISSQFYPTYFATDAVFISDHSVDCPDTRSSFY